MEIVAPVPPPNSAELEDKYKLPISMARFIETAPYTEPADGSAQAKLDEYKTLEEAIPKLYTQDELEAKMKPILHEIRGLMQQKSLEIDKLSRHAGKLDKKPNFVHKSVNVKASFYIHPEAHKIAPINEVAKQIKSDLEADNEEYKKKGTKHINQGIKLSVFLLEILKVQFFYKQIVLRVAPPTISLFKKLKKDHYTKHQDRLPRDKNLLSEMALWHVIQRLDKPLLAYFHLNRSYMEKLFFQDYKPKIKSEELNELDKFAVIDARDTILRLIKPVTVNHHASKRVDYAIKNATAQVVAELEKTEASDAVTAINQAIKTASPSLPKDNTTLKKAVRVVVQEDKEADRKKAAKKQKNRKRTPPTTTAQPDPKRTKTSPKGNGAANQPAASQTNGGNTTTTNTNSNNRNNRNNQSNQRNSGGGRGNGARARGNGNGKSKNNQSSNRKTKGRGKGKGKNGRNNK